jgi:hypothetical protein
VDNVKIRDGLTPRWSLPFQQLVEWKLDVLAIAHTHLIALKSQIIWYGNPPVHFQMEVSAHLDQWIERCETQTQVYNYLQSIRQQYSGNKRGFNLAIQELLKRAKEVRKGYASGDHKLAVATHYAAAIYASDYEGPVWHGRVKDAPVSVSVLRERLSILRPQIDSGIKHFGRQLSTHQDVAKLTLPPIKYQPPDHAYLNEIINL